MARDESGTATLMLFNSFDFLVFFSILLGLLLATRENVARKTMLLIASCIFYMWWNPALILLIAASTILDYLVGLGLGRTNARSARKLLLFASLAGNLGLLGYFKYAGFLQESLFHILRAFGYTPGWVALNVTLPVGISFYTFQTLSYTIDVYRREIPPTKSPLDFALFIAFFPQLVAGPIVRARDFLPQLQLPVRLDLRREHALRILRGLIKKVVIADGLSPFVDTVFSTPGQFPSVIIWLAAISFAAQIYCDFSGYTDIAIGVARILGFELTRNFDWPYFARNPSDFWRRWHISLSTWLRDYVYIPLGGNRASAARVYFNLLVTMVLGGLWHGASWNFVLWGLVHGLLLVGYRAYRGTEKRRTVVPSSGIPTWAAVSATQYAVLVTWIVFRVSDTQDLWTSLRKFVLFDFDFSLANRGLGSADLFSTTVLVLVFWTLHVISFRSNGLDNAIARRSFGTYALIGVVAGMVLFVLWPSAERPFIYFQF